MRPIIAIMLMYVFHYVFSLWPGGTWNPLGPSGWSISPPTTAFTCNNIARKLALENTTILSASYLSAGSYIPEPGPSDCFPPSPVPVHVCQVRAKVKASLDSSVNLVIWLPDYDLNQPDQGWNHRFLTVGNSELAGCIDYLALSYGVSMRFATIASDNGHTGKTGQPFLHRPEVINDFAHRAIHVAAVVGKVIVQSYYSIDLSSFNSYYLGCSTGGRQGIQSALMHPDDFNGIIAGAPAVDWNHLMSWGGMLTKYLGPQSSHTFIPDDLWKRVHDMIMMQCDIQDGVLDGMLTEPDDCVFDPETLPFKLCTAPGQSDCFSQLQVNVLRKFYQPLRGKRMIELYPRFDPGAELDLLAQPLINNNGTFYSLTEDWYKYAIYNDSTLTPDDFWNFGLSDIAFADSINPGGIATWDGDLSTFESLGGKLLTFHGRADGAIPSGISKRLHGLVSSVTPNIDDFYRLFLVPGLHHCFNANFPQFNNTVNGSAWNIGQGPIPQHDNKNDSNHNILLALVDWVEKGPNFAPPAMIGVGENGEERKHCMYPQRSILSGNHQWECFTST